jgi:transposase
MWLADLLAHGLIRSSFVPPTPIQELRDLTRTRRQLVREISQHSLRIQKVLEDANIKMASVLSNILGVSGRAMLRALIAGVDDPVRLAALAHGTARKKRTELIEALRGRPTPHHRMMLTLHLDVVTALETALREVDATLGKALAPIQARANLLTTMPGVSDLVAQVILAEIGVDMTRFPTAAHLVSWARSLSPERRERRQAPLDARAEDRPVAEDDPRNRGMGSRAREGDLSPWPVPPDQGAARAQEGHPRGRGVYADRGVLHAPRRCPVPRPGLRVFGPP